MTATDERTIDPDDLAAKGVHWDLQPNRVDERR